jgi:hypothetical protein
LHSLNEPNTRRRQDQHEPGEEPFNALQKGGLRMSTKFLVLAFSFGGTLGNLRADEVTIVSSRDNTLFEDPTGSLSDGAGEDFFSGRTNQDSNSIRRGLLYFHIGSAVPSGSVITQVTLTLYLNKTITPDPKETSLHRAFLEWGEGTSNSYGEGSGAPATPGDATWLHTFYDTLFWSSAGGDFEASPSATTTLGYYGYYTWSSTQMIADVQSWLDSPASNAGWVVIGDESKKLTATRFNSREFSGSGNRHPRLRIEFCPPASWSNYGTGWPGTFGTPSLTADAAPELGTQIAVLIDNSAAAPTTGLLFLGFTAVQVPTNRGGSLLVLPLVAWSLSLVPGTNSLPARIPAEPSWCGIAVLLQVIEVDRGASHGLSFTPGLRLELGN